ncbi:FecR family protein [uncultured Bacteroides sp.]|uniref:FecR family protein n=1 Tax=uncultured Bacteroides sp. TaxID=162156 RepID=UPI0026758ECF|nr:FecR domain-containing protein [uncultured Bacteroides sp.]
MATKSTDPTKLINTIKKMLTKGLTASEKIELSEEKPVEYLLHKQWEKDSSTHIKDQVDPTEIWNHIISACWPHERKISRNRRYLRIGYSAAAVCLILLAGMWIADYFSNPYITISTPPGKEQTVATLPDNSKIRLKKGSSIRYKSKFIKNRDVTLTGEATFDVAKSSHPFRVYFQNAHIEVKGTEFNIKSYNEQTEITLYTGSIEFSAEPLRNSIAMKPSEQIVYNALTHQITSHKIDLEDYDWHSEEYHFVDKPMSELIRLINKSYKTNIKIYDEQNAQNLFTGKIRKNETLEDVLDKICISFNLKIKQEKDSIILY